MSYLMLKIKSPPLKMMPIKIQTICTLAFQINGKKIVYVIWKIVHFYLKLPFQFMLLDLVANPGEPLSHLSPQCQKKNPRLSLNQNPHFFPLKVNEVNKSSHQLETFLLPHSPYGVILTWGSDTPNRLVEIKDPSILPMAWWWTLNVPLLYQQYGSRSPW